ncbi:GNAT family N-acetyltransferase [Rhodobacter sp. Har01]|uniref:GNAT family N-acetyltransferase n=1 Tax=Rhodobacter sp. Har01 TaxID=2883999 RepID=UPI001D0687C6|nr:GNAT family N-acetyltransferase [Rhodobacter sp. Har01]MCB6179190.1 GNAT family N-acetyltransferase [Rhodobacter sp. Har01]
MDSPRILPLTPDLIPEFVGLFGPQGACAGCWCTIFRVPAKAWSKMPGDERRALTLDRIRRGPPPGLLALDGDQAVGWMQVGPRSDVPEWNNPGRVSSPLPDAPADDPAVWAITCFFFRRPWRGRGLTHALLAEGIAFARANGARLLEAAPMVKAKQSKSIPLFVGPAATFRKAGFLEVACRKEGRPLMRLTLDT